MQLHSTVKPGFNRVPRDWGNLSVILRVYYIRNLDLTNFRENNQNYVCSTYGGVVMGFYCSAFLDLIQQLINIFSFLSTELYEVMALETQEQANKTG